MVGAGECECEWVRERPSLWILVRRPIWSAIWADWRWTVRSSSCNWFM